MTTALQIFTHGWLGNSVSVFTLGYHPREGGTIDGLICTAWSAYMPGATLSVFVPEVSFSVEVC